jgi:nucleoside-diphosphate-sugar epimerase
MADILIVGCGSIGSGLALQLSGQGHRVTGLKRCPPPGPHAFAYVAADITRAETLQKVRTDFDQVFFIVSADGRSEQSYRDVYQAGLDNVLARFAGLPLIFVSSTSVYGQSRGEWVDETSEAEPEHCNGRLIRQGERKVLAVHSKNTVVRFSGIYGPGRDYLLRKTMGVPVIQKTPPYYTNRIHQQDCIGVLSFLLSQRLAGAAMESYYLASDDDPAPLWEVVSWLAERMHCPPPVAQRVPDEAPMNKRCRNTRLKALGYRFLFPSYKEGYGERLKEMPSSTG